MQGLSVIICCYNSVLRLPNTLKYLASQQVPAHIYWEVVIVNNACTDNIEEVALTEWLKYSLPNVECKVVYEPNPGLNNAREKGVKESKFEYLIFCDDDNWLCKDYLYKVNSLFESMPEAGMIGGVGEAVFESEPPQWFLKMEGFGYAVGTEKRNTGYVHSVYGAGMAIRKSTFLSIINKGISFLVTDRKGKSLSSGGDSELSLLINLAGKKVYLDTALTFKHFLPAKRLEWKYYLKLRRSFGKADAYLKLYNKVLLPDKFVNQKENVLKHVLRFLRYLICHFPYVLFPGYFKNSKCAHCVQTISMQLTTISEFKKLQEAAYQVEVNFRKEIFVPVPSIIN